MYENEYTNLVFFLDSNAIRNETSTNTESDCNRILRRIASENSSEDKMTDADFIYRNTPNFSMRMTV